MMIWRHGICCVLYLSVAIAIKPVWKWECVNNNCQKQRVRSSSDDPITGLGVCQLLCCKDGSLWPKPTGTVSIGKKLVILDPNNINVFSGHSENVLNDLIPAGIENFLGRIQSLAQKQSIAPEGKTLEVTLDILNPEIKKLTLHLNEGYKLQVSESSEGLIQAIITADNYFGGRHGLETLGQLIIYDEIYNNLKIPSEVFITDMPVYTYRGIMLDTSRNYISKEAIKRTIDGMSAAKLNTFHWHITDSHSFPYVSSSHPELAQIGAYGQGQVYTAEDVAEIVRFGLEHGVRILPELDAPAHVGEGWQDTNFLVCFKKEPWADHCLQPPCGQFDPTKDELYDVLEDIYGDFVKQFDPDIFHMGGDEVTFPCWNSSTEITKWMRNQGWGTDEADFVKLWNAFQSRALERFDKQAKQELPIILWSSTLTARDYIEKYLSKDRYVIQIWAKSDEQEIKDLLGLGYNAILTNYDALYLDCGVAAWVTNGSNWCSPYKGWHQLYDNSPAKIGGDFKNQFLGAEAALWSEQADDASIDNRIWPRAAAMAERLWGEPKTIWREAEQRMLIHRQRLIERGIHADTLEPQWCMQHQQSCPLEKIN